MLARLSSSSVTNFFSFKFQGLKFTSAELEAAATVPLPAACSATSSCMQCHFQLHAVIEKRT